VINQQQSARFGKLAAQIRWNERLKISASFNVFRLRARDSSTRYRSAHYRSARILRAVRAHPARIHRYPRPNPLSRDAHRCVVDLFVANARGNLIQNVIEFLVFHNLTPRMIPKIFLPFRGGLLPAILSINFGGR
jgi:hypothetical protein